MSQHILEKIRKLQALADRAGTEAEAANAAERVRELLLKHNLEIGSIALEVEDGSDVEVEEEFRRVWDYHRNLAWACDELFDVLHYTRWRRIAHRMKKTRFHFIGLAANVEAASLTFSYFCASVEALLEGWKSTYTPDYYWEGPAFAYRGFRTGAAGTILQMAREFKRQSEEHNSGAAEIMRVADSVARKVHDRMKFGRSRRLSQSLAIGSPAYFDGCREARRIDIHGARTNRLLR